MNYNLEEKLKRILEFADWPSYESDQRSLLHAYIACFSFSELCLAIVATIESPSSIRLALRSRLLRLLEEDSGASGARSLIQLFEDTRNQARENIKLRVPVDALHSAIFEHLPLLNQQEILDGWIARRTRGAAARWLKATQNVPALFDTKAVTSYWRTSRDWRSAKSLAYQAEPDALNELLAELIDHCTEGWIISKAVLRASTVNESLWPVIRAEHPVTYLYLCARMNRSLSDDDAFELISQCSRETMGSERGLAIWAVGQMRKISVLDRIFNDTRARKWSVAYYAQTT